MILHSSEWKHAVLLGTFSRYPVAQLVDVYFYCESVVSVCVVVTVVRAVQEDDIVH